MGGKWTQLKKDVPRLELEETYQTRVDEEKARMGGRVVTPERARELAELFKELKYQKGRLEDDVKALNLQLEATQQLLLPWFEDQGISQQRLSSGGLLSEDVQPQAQLVDEDAFLKWLMEVHPAERLKFPSPSLSRLVKECLTEGTELPPGVAVNCKVTLKLYGG